MAARKRAKKAGADSGAEAAPMKFEAALERLETLVDTLEQGDLELEQSLEVFEEGVSLSKHCAKELESAERRIEVLIEEGGEWLSRSFEDGDADFDDGDEDAEEDEDEDQ